jgi:2-methylisocitrate lyase-like PEP mutase family enzyme
LDVVKAKADLLLGLHHGYELLVLPNAWDCMSARVLEDCGFPAIATTSAGIAWAFGYPDGEGLGREEMAEATARIAGAVSVPVTADAEAGYGATPDAASETALAVIRAGAVGLNLETRWIPNRRTACAPSVKTTPLTLWNWRNGQRGFGRPSRLAGR